MSSDFLRTASPELNRLLPENLTVLLNNARLVKHNPVRDVFQSSEFFIKVDHRKNHTFKAEFATGTALEKAGIPVVSHLAYGRCGSDNFLITRALADAVQADIFLKQPSAETGFISAFEELMTKWEKSRFFHADPHFGNLLYCPGTNKLFLVDVHDVKKPLFFLGKRSDIPRFIFNLRGRVPHRTVLELLKKFHSDDPQKDFYKAAAKDIARIKAEWPKRRAQLFAAYPKFSVRCGEWLAAADFQECFDSLPEFPAADGGRIFAAGAFLELLQIPHRRCAAVNLGSGKVKFEPELSGTADCEEKAVLKELLDMCGFESSVSEYSLRHGLAAVNDISGLANQPFFRMEE